MSPSDIAAPRSIELSDDELVRLDVLQFNAGENPSGSAQNGFTHPKAFYRDTIARFGFEGMDRVLDLLCGFGRWTVFLAERNRSVVGLDRNEGAVRIGQGLAQHLGMDNATFRATDVSGTSAFESGCFDGVWIWAGLVYVERAPCLQEAWRLLKPGGRLLVGQMNTTGRLLEKLVEGVAGDTPRHASLREQAVDALARGPGFDGVPNYCTEADAGETFARFGFRVLEVEPSAELFLERAPLNLHVLAEKEKRAGRSGVRRGLASLLPRAR